MNLFARIVSLAILVVSVFALWLFPAKWSYYDLVFGVIVGMAGFLTTFLKDSYKIKYIGTILLLPMTVLWSVVERGFEPAIGILGFIISWAELHNSNLDTSISKNHSLQTGSLGSDPNLHTPTFRHEIFQDSIQAQLLFVGRQSTVAEIKERLNQRDAIALIGLPGIGKSAIARHFARTRSHFKSRHELNLATARTDLDLANSLRAFLLSQGFNYQGIVGIQISELINVFRNNFTERTVLIIDNADWLERQLLRQLLLPPPHYTIITSRISVNITLDLKVSRFSDDETLQFLEALLQRSIEDTDAAIRLANRLGNHPLAMKIVASRMVLTGKSCVVALAELTDNRDLFRKLRLRINSPDYDENIEAAFAPSYHHLSEHSKTVFHAAGLGSVSGLPISALNYMLEQSRIDIEQAVIELAQLSLIEIKDNIIGMHPLLHEYARQLAKSNQAQEKALAKRHGKYFGKILHRGHRMVIRRSIRREGSYDEQEVISRIKAVYENADNILLAESRNLLATFDTWNTFQSQIAVSSQRRLTHLSEKSIEYQEKYAKALWLRSKSYFFRFLRQPIKAYFNLINAARVFKNLDTPSEYVYVLREIGMLLERSGKSNLAVRRYLQAIPLFIEINNHANAALLYERIARLTGQLEYYQKAISLIQDAEPLLVAKFRMGYGHDLIKQREFRLAISELQQASIYFNMIQNDKAINVIDRLIKEASSNL